MEAHNRRQLLWRVTLPVLLFVALGSLALVGVLHSVYRRQSRLEFSALADANAEFFQTVRVPATERFADYLKRVLNLDVYFRLPSGVLVPVPAEQGDTLRSLTLTHAIVPLGHHHEAVAVPAGESVVLILVRERPGVSNLLLRPATFGVLAVFWILSVGLAWALTRWIVRPYLQTLERLAQTERLALLGKMATALAHEIQNPVAAIRLHAQLMESESPATAGLIIHEAADIESLVNQWMFLARPEPPQTNGIALGELLGPIVRRLESQAEHARVKIILSGEPGAVVQADVRRLGQAFQNIIVNAMQAMPQGGTVTIRVQNSVVEFADTGPGFSPTALARYAEIFYTEREGGMGIGLSVAQEIVKAHGGRLTVQNQTTGGALVRVEL